MKRVSEDDTLALQRTFTVEELLTYLLSFGAFVTFNAEDYGDDVELLMEAWLHFNRQTRGNAREAPAVASVPQAGCAGLAAEL